MTRRIWLAVLSDGVGLLKRRYFGCSSEMYSLSSALPGLTQRQLDEAKQTLIAPVAPMNLANENEESTVKKERGRKSWAPPVRGSERVIK